MSDGNGTTTPTAVVGVASFPTVLRDLLISSRRNLVEATDPATPSSEFGFRAWLAGYAGLAALLMEELRQRDPERAENIALLLDDRLGDGEYIADWVAAQLHNMGIDVETLATTTDARPEERGERP